MQMMLILRGRPEHVEMVLEKMLHSSLPYLFKAPWYLSRNLYWKIVWGKTLIVPTSFDLKDDDDEMTITIFFEKKKYPPLKWLKHLSLHYSALSVGLAWNSADPPLSGFCRIRRYAQPERTIYKTVKESLQTQVSDPEIFKRVMNNFI